MTETGCGWGDCDGECETCHPEDWYDERLERLPYHGPGEHADDCDCADCLANLPPEWFEEYAKHRAEECA